MAAIAFPQRPPAPAAEPLEQYPEPAKMPSDLVFELAMNLAEMGDFDRASALFRDRFFPRQEGGTNVRQVWIEVQLLRDLLDAKRPICGDAMAAHRMVAVGCDRACGGKTLRRLAKGGEPLSIDAVVVGQKKAHVVIVRGR